jgi:hypothetical protein
MGCLMHLEGRAKKEGRAFEALHVAQVLRDALHSKRPMNGEAAS